jgi:DNA repair exonuclease SbcCD ATPase subunit
MHPLYRVLLAHKRQENPNFESWTKLNRPISGGLLQRHNVNEHGVLIRKSKSKPPKRPRQEGATTAGEVPEQQPKRTNTTLELQAKIQKLTAEINDKNNEIHDLKDTIKTNEDAARLLSNQTAQEKTELERHNQQLAEDLAKSNAEKIAADNALASLQRKYTALEAERMRLVRSKTTPSPSASSAGPQKETSGSMYPHLDFETHFHMQADKCDKLTEKLSEKNQECDVIKYELERTKQALNKARQELEECKRSAV